MINMLPCPLHDKIEISRLSRFKEYTSIALGLGR